MHGHGRHPPGPDQQRIRRIGGALIAVPAALDDQPQIVRPGKVDSSHHIGGALGRDGIGARRRRPGIHPAERLRQADVIAQEIRVFQVLEQLRAIAAGRRLGTGGERRGDRDQPSADGLPQRVPACLRRPSRLAGADAGHRSGGAGGCKGGSQAIAPDWLSAKAAVCRSWRLFKASSPKSCPSTRTVTVEKDLSKEHGKTSPVPIFRPRQGRATVPPLRKSRRRSRAGSGAGRRGPAL